MRSFLHVYELGGGGVVLGIVSSEGPLSILRVFDFREISGWVQSLTTSRSHASMSTLDHV